jgi:electron-transferring-flavoprotein dehydrogenase
MTDTPKVEREQLEADVLIIGAGPGGLACALHLANLIEKHTEAKKSPALSAENIYVLEKGREIGAHQLSGAIMDPRGLRELVPDFEKTAPLDTPVTGDAAYYFTESSSYKLPITPPPLQNHGNYVVSLNRLVKWLGALVEKKGINIFTQFAGRELLYDENGIAGVLTEDKGVDKNGKPKDNFTPGYELRAKVTVLAEGPRGSLTKELVNKRKLDGLNPQVYGIGIKELWDVQPGRIDTGYVAHTLGWPLSSDLYGGGWVYGLQNNRVSLGMVIALEYKDPLFDPHEAFQKYKTHPFVRKILEGGKLVRYGAKTVPYAAQLRGWRLDHRRFREPSEFAAAEGDSHRDQERHARGRNHLRSAMRRRYFRKNAGGISAKNRTKLDQKRIVGSPQFSSGFSRRPIFRARASRIAIRHGRPRTHRSKALQARLSGICEAKPR